MSSARTLYDMPNGGLTPSQFGPVQLSRPFANTAAQDTYCVERMLQYGVQWQNFLSNQRIAIQTSYTNLLQYSEQMDNAAWTASSSVINANQMANPADGLVTADIAQEVAATAQHGFKQTYTFSAGTYTYSIFAKPSGRDYIYLETNDGTTTRRAWFNITTGAAGSSTGTGIVGYSMYAVGGGYYRCQITFTAVLGSGYVFNLLSTADTVTSYAGDATKGAYFWGAQLEAAATAGPYIVTTTTTYTNLITFSEQLDNAAWTPSSTTVTANSIANPLNGASTADSLIETATNTFHNIGATAITIVSGSPYCYSLYVKSGGPQYIQVGVSGSFGTFLANFDIINGLVTFTNAFGGATYLGSGITNLGGGWFRIYIAGSKPATSAVPALVAIAGPTDAWVAPFLGSISNIRYIYGNQVEQALTPSPYVATTSAPASGSFGSRTVSCPDWWDSALAGALDPVQAPDPFSFLVNESDPTMDSQNLYYVFKRTFSRIPRPQITQSTMQITKPSPNSVGTVASVIQYPGTISLGTIGTFYGTTHLFIGGTINKVFGPAVASTSANSGSDTNITVASTAGLNVATDLALNFGAGSSISYIPAGTWSITSGTVIKVTGTNFSTSIGQIAPFLRSYTPGSAMCQIQQTTTFYLPGVTTGITLATDISVPTTALSDAAFLAAALGNLSGYIGYSSLPLQQYEGTIYQQTVTAVNAGSL